MASTPENNKVGKLGVSVLCITSCLLAVVLVGLFEFSIIPSLTLIVVNVLCIPMAVLDLAVGFVEDKNKRKAYLFAAALIVCLLMSYENVHADMPIQGVWGSVSAWGKAWMFTAALSLIAFIIIAVRLFRWSQPEWDHAKQMSQELRLGLKESWANRLRSLQAHRADMASQKYEHKKRMRATKEQHDLDKQQSNHTRKKAEWQARAAQTGENPHASKMKTVTTGFKDFFMRRILPILIAALFVFIPICGTITDSVTSWVNKIIELVNLLLGQGKIENGLEALLNYMLLFALGTGIVAVIVIIGAQIFGNSPKRIKEYGDNDFSEKYATPLAILVVAWAALMVLTQGTYPILFVSDSWGNLLASILFILVVLASIEIVRLVLEQCARKDSLLNKLIWLMLVVVLEFFVNLILGVIISFRIQTVISALFSLVFPEPNEGFQRRIDYILQTLFSRELDNIVNPPSRNMEFQKFHRKHVWRRRKK